MVLPATLDPTGPLDSSIGALYIGMLFSAVLYGFCLLQTLLYFQKYAQDPWHIKTAVVTLMTFDTIHLCLVAISVYHYVISNYHHPEKLQYMTWPILMESAFVAANTTTVHVFYIYRVYRLSEHKITFIPLCGIFLLLACVEAGVGITWLVLAMKMTKWHDLLKIAPLATAILSLSCSIDILVAGTLCILLHRARTGFKRSDSMINKLIIFIISTGSLTAIFALLALISLLSTPYSLIYGALVLCIGHLYTNSFLTTLNVRSINHVDETGFKSTNLVFHEMTTSKRRSINIRIDTIQEAVPDKTVTQRIPESTATKGHNIDSLDIDFPSQKGHFLCALS